MIPSAAKPPLFLAAKDHIARRVIASPRAANYEAEFSQSGAKTAIVSADKSIGKATAILHIIGEQFMVSLEFDFDVKDLYSVCTRA